MSRTRASSLLTLLAVATLAPCQSPTTAIAKAWVAAEAPATDDPDARVRDLVTTALQHRRSPLAFVLLDQALAMVPMVQALQDVRAWLRAQPTTAPMHGRCAQRLRELDWYLSLAIDGSGKTGPCPAGGYAHDVLAIGPFGDAGDHFVGLPFAPEFTLPALGAELPGRGRLAHAMRVVNRPYSDYLDLDRFAPGQDGCWYGALRLAADAELRTFLEVACPGDHQVFVDGREVLRVERWRASAPQHHYVALHVPAGEHSVLVKAASLDATKITVRCVDAECQPTPAARFLPVGDAAPAHGSEPARRTDELCPLSFELWARAADAADADPAVRVAALLHALRDGHTDQALRHVEILRANPPSDATTALALANALHAAPLPEETRRAEARKLVERAAATLGDDHHAARLWRSTLLEEQDQREAALRLLQGHPAPGPATWRRRYEVLRQLRFRAEFEPHLTEWIAACPLDPRPLVLAAGLAEGVGDTARALALRQRAVALRVDLGDVVHDAFHDALHTGDLAAATTLLDLAEPGGHEPEPLNRLWLQYEMATARSDAAASATLRQRLLAHPEISAPWLAELAARAVGAEDPAGALACLDRALQLQPDVPAWRSWRQALRGGEPEPFATFQRDGDAAIAAFTPGEAERGASTSVLIDQRILVVEPDGSWTAEQHRLLRVNDQAGVEAFAGGIGIGSSDEVLLVRTRTADGDSYVPSRIDDDYAFQRLQPGAFVEWRTREHGSAPVADAVDTGTFVFGDAEAPTAVSEFVLVLPAQHRGELRRRGVAAGETRTLPDGRVAHVLRRERAERLAAERFLPSQLELLPCAQFGEDRSPFAGHRGRRIDLLHGTRPTAPIAARARELTAAATTPAERAALLHAFCQQHIEDGPAQDALETLLRGKGDRFQLLVALLRGADLPVVPMVVADARAELTSEDSLFDHGGRLDTDGAALLLPGSAPVLLFEDTPRHWPLGAVPGGRGGADALLLHDDRDEPLQVPGGGAAQAMRIRGTATLRSKDLRLQVEAELLDVPGFALAEQLRQQKDNVRKLAARQVAQQMFPGCRVESAALQLDATDRPLRITATLLRSGVQADGDRVVVPLPLPTTKLLASFGDRAERTLPFHIAIGLATDWEIELQLGDDVNLLSVPPPVAIHHGAFTFTQRCDLGAGKLTVRRHTTIGTGRGPASAFGEWLRALGAADRAEQATLELKRR